MIAVPFRLGGRVRMIGRRRNSARLIADWQRNLIPDSGLDMMATSKAYLDACQIGRSSLPPSVVQTALIEPLAGTANRIAANSSAANASPWRGFSQVTYKFPVGAATGLISELGIGPSATPGDPIFSRVLIHNAFGQPKGVRVLADESLEVEYELSCYAPPIDVTGTILVGGIERAWTARAALASTGQYWAPYRSGSFATAAQAVQALFASAAGSQAIAYDGGIGAITSSPGGVGVNVTEVANEEYVPGSFSRSAAFGWEPNSANHATGIRSVLISMNPGVGAGGNSLGAYQVEFSPPIAKTSDASFLLRAGISWGRQ